MSRAANTDNNSTDCWTFSKSDLLQRWLHVKATQQVSKQVRPCTHLNIPSKFWGFESKPCEAGTSVSKTHMTLSHSHISPLNEMALQSHGTTFILHQ